MKPFDFLHAAATGMTGEEQQPGTTGSTLTKKGQAERKKKNTRAKLARRKNRRK